MMDCQSVFYFFNLRRIPSLLDRLVNPRKRVIRYSGKRTYGGAYDCSSTFNFSYFPVHDTKSVSHSVLPPDGYSFSYFPTHLFLSEANSYMQHHLVLLISHLINSFPKNYRTIKLQLHKVFMLHLQ